ncbi:Protein serine/threonine kinase [Entamoeba marina]
MVIATFVFFLFFTFLTRADCVCTPLTDFCTDGYSNTCGSSSFCDSINITTEDYELTQECIDSNNKVPYLEMYAGSFTLQDNFFKTSGGIHFKKTSYMLWYGFNNFEQVNEVTYVDHSYIVHKSPLNMDTSYLYFPSPVDFKMVATFTLSGDAIFEFGGNTKGIQYLLFDSDTTTLRDESILNISTAYFFDPLKFILYNNSKLISAAIGRDNKNGKLYFYDSSSLILDEGHYNIFMIFIHYFYDNSILQVERDTKSYLEQVYLYDNSFLNISESSFIRFDSFSLSSTASVKIGEDSVIQTPLSLLNGKITFSNKARLNSKTSTSSLPSSFSLEVIETIIGYPIISLWNVTSMLSNINEITYNGNECIDVYSFASSNTGLTLPSKYYQLANNQLIRYCPSSVDYDVHCYLNTSIWSNDFIDISNGYPIFISPHCMNSYYSNYLCHSIQNTFEVGTDSINITFAEVLDTIIISEPTYNQQIINGYFNTIETTFGLKFILNQNTKSSTLKSEIIEPNTFIEIDTSTTINTINDEIQLDLTSLTYSPSSIYIVNASIIEIIDDSTVTLDHSTTYIRFINSNNYKIDVNFTQNEIGFFSENGFDINDGNICSCLLFCYYEYINLVVVLFQDNSFICLNIKLQKPCDEGYYESNNYTVCSKCSMNNCKRCTSTECYLCSNGYYLENGKCIEKETTCEYAKSNECIKCSNGYYIENGICFNCGSNCISCTNSITCSICNSSLNIDGSCNDSIENGDILSNDNIISCNSNYYLNNSECVDCNSTYSNCKECTNTHCITCQDTYELTNNYECIPTHCNDINCTSCEDGYVLDQNGKCNLEIESCLITINDECVDCSNELYPSKQGCVDPTNNCIIVSTTNGCLRCADGMFLEDKECKLCSSNCSTCINTEDTCLTCSPNEYLENYECKTNEELNGTCSTLIATGSGCAICNNGYYRNGLSCYECMSECSTCLTNDTCLTCTDDYFMSVSGDCLLQSTIIGCAIEISTINGCTQCNDGYYNYNKICYSCNEECSNCSNCSNSNECTSCQNDYVLIDEKCIHYQLIDNCKESGDSKCSSCSFWHTLNSDQTGCDTQVVWWVIVLIILFVLIIMICICVLIWYIIKLLFDWRKQQKQRKETTIFDMSRSNIKFIPTNNKDVVINKDEILFNDECEEIGVNEETRDLICVGNTSKHTIKVQFSVKEGCDKYEIRTNPQLITIPKGKAVEFEIFIKPLCTCKINDQIMLISVDLTKGKTIITPITINTITIMTSRLDYDELIEDIKLGEGSFGIVYQGTFRGNQVAIKKMKQLNNKEQMEEFNKEVSMLDKFRNDYIVHFYGAVFIPTKICMVTEFAQYGSLQDLIRKSNPIDYSMKMKILLDCSKGISYLHSNGILHRDIKPDNFLILSLDTSAQVNAKLTDFGASRNINMMMTNMTFTKGIGTPIYMAPEILNRQKYKKSADIYSFAITIYQTMIWDNAYDKTQFIYPWDIAEFVSKGERLEKPNTMNETIYSLISNCWKQEPKERYEIEDVIEKIETMT